jgi:hypothetical protein
MNATLRSDRAKGVTRGPWLSRERVVPVHDGRNPLRWHRDWLCEGAGLHG